MTARITSPVIPHPPFHPHQLPTLLLLPLGDFATSVAMAASSFEKKKNLKIPKKKKTSYCNLCTLRCTKINFCLKKYCKFFEIFRLYKK
jgi:hypothetical protein